MHVYVQWANRHPKDWQRVEGHEWASTPKKPVPDGTEVLDDEPGHLFDVNVQGVTYQGWDAVAVEPTDFGLRVYCWNDDIADHQTPVEGMVWEFHEPAHSPRLHAFNGLGPDDPPSLNTVQYVTYYGSDQRWQTQNTEAGPVICRPWSEFPRPDESIVRYGIWLPAPWPDTPKSANRRHKGIYPNDHGPEAHVAARQHHGWQEWLP